MYTLLFSVFKKKVTYRLSSTNELREVTPKFEPRLDFQGNGREELRKGIALKGEEENPKVLS